MKITIDELRKDRDSNDEVYQKYLEELIIDFSKISNHIKIYDCNNKLILLAPDTISEYYLKKQLLEYGKNNGWKIDNLDVHMELPTFLSFYGLLIKR